MEDSKTAIVNFLATLVNKSSKLNLDFDTIIGGGLKAQPVLTSSNSQLFPAGPSTKPESTITKTREESSNICRFNLSKIQVGPFEMFLERDFAEGSQYRTEEPE